MDFLEYGEALCEQRGAMLPGKLKVTDQEVSFKYRKSGKTEQFAGRDIELLNWHRMSGDWALRIFLKNGELYRFGGFKEADHDKISKFFQTNFKVDMAPKQLSLRGWNWGAALFKGNALSFDVEEQTAFEIPLGYVSQCQTGKNEVTLEFHTNDDAAVSLMEMRFHVPPTAENSDPTEAFQDQVMKKASVMTATGDVLAIFREVQCLTPRGRYDIGMYPTFINMHGKTFDFKIPISTVQRLFLLPHRDGRQTFFVLALDPPMKQGMTRYHFLILRFDIDEDEEMDIELAISDEELKEKYDNRLPKELKGKSYEVLSKMVKGITNKKLTIPGSFKGQSSTPAIACSYKAAAGFLYPLDRGYMYIHKPPIYIRIEEIVAINFARSGGGTRTFDMEIEIRNNIVHTFSSIEKEEYSNLFSFATEKKIRIKSKGGLEKGANYDLDEDGDAADPYLERMKREGEERDEDDSDEDESTDEDFNPEGTGGGSDVAEEFESNPETTESEADPDDPEAMAKKKKKQEKKEKERKRATESKKSSKPKRSKKDSGAPKRPMSAYFLWLNENRERIKEENPGISITEISKKAGEMWRELKDKSEWEEKAKKAKSRYEEEMREWRASGGQASGGKTPKNKSPKKSAVVSSSGGGGGAGFKSKEYIDSDSDSDEDSKKKKKIKSEPKSSPKAKKSDNDEPEEEAESTPASSEASGGSDADSD